MLLRKTLAYFITSVSMVLLLVIIPFLQGEYDAVYYAFLVACVVFPIILLYGLPVSIMADVVTKPFEMLGLGLARTLISLLIHLVLGLGFVFIYALVYNDVNSFTSFNVFWATSKIQFIASTLASFLFWLMDEWLRTKFRKYKQN